jgi:hypothetical protein
MFSQYTSYLANRLCGGSSRKLIAGWWYSILALTAALLVVSVHDPKDNYKTITKPKNNNKGIPQGGIISPLLMN